MYSDFYGFKREPFNVTPDSDFIFYSDQHKETLASMLYGIQERKGLILVTGRVGSGKTTLCRALLGELGEDTQTASVVDTKMRAEELLEAICADLEIPVEPDDGVKQRLRRLRDRGRQLQNRGKNLCVIVDESQNCPVDALEALLELSRADGDETPPIQVILVGQPELENRLNHPDLREYKGDVSVRTHLTNMAEEDVAGYVQHRLERAEPDQPVTVDSSVYPALYAASGGNPRAINLLCDRSLMAAYVEDSTNVNREHLERAKQDLAEHTRSNTVVDPRILYQLEPSDSPGGSSWGSRIRRNPAAVGISFGVVILAAVFMLTRWFAGGSGPPPGEQPAQNPAFETEVRLFSQPQTADTGARDVSGGETTAASAPGDTRADLEETAPSDTGPDRQ